MNRTEMTGRIFREVGIIQERADFFLKRDLPPDLPPVQFRLLNHLQMTTNRDETPSDLARNSLVSLSAMSQVIKQLAMKGYVKLEPQPHDIRRKVIRITDGGRAAYQAALGAVRDDFTPVATRLPAQDLEILLGVLRRFREAFETATEAAAATREDVR